MVPLCTCPPPHVQPSTFPAPSTHSHPRSVLHTVRTFPNLPPGWTSPGLYLPSILPVSGVFPRSDFLRCLCTELLSAVCVPPPLSHACVF